MPEFSTSSTNFQIHHIHSRLPALGGFLMYFHGSASTEQPGYRGLTHLAEHLLCKPLDKHSDLMTRLGIDHNASTSPTTMSLHCFGLSDNVDTFVNTAIFGKHGVLDYIPSPEEFEQERNVVLQEYEGYFSNPMACLKYNIMRKHYGFFSDIGYSKDIREITYDDFIGFYKTTIVPTGIVTSSTDQEWMKPGRFESPCVRMHSQRPYLKPLADPLVDINESFGTSNRQTFIADWFTFDCIPFERKFMQALWNEGTPASAPLMSVLRDKHGLAYSAYINFECRPTDMATLYVTTSPENTDKARELAYNVLRNWRDYITFERYDAIYSCVETELKKASVTNFEYSWFARFASTEDTRLSLNKIKSMTFEHVFELHKQFDNMEIHVAQTGETMEV